MNLLKDVSLQNYSTMRLGGTARYLTDIHDRNQLVEALTWAEDKQLPVIMIGGGSNIYWQDSGFDGLVMVNKIMRYEVFEEDDLNAYITVGAGENWDSVVKRSVDAGLSGIEALSLIPGTAGGTPIQNVGAYGERISRVLTTVEAYDTQSKDFVTIPGSDCQFAYRTSRFKAADKGRFFITALTLHLTRSHMEPPFYEALQAYFDQHQTTDRSPAAIREAVIAIRNTKLPDPAVVANNGSFFANPVITEEHALQLQTEFPDLPCWPGDDGMFKVPAAWLIEHVGMKDFHDPETGMATWHNHALVLVNEHAHSTADILKFKQKIVDAVYNKYRITLEQEPELLP